MTPRRKRLVLGIPLTILTLYVLWYLLLSPELYMTCREVSGFGGTTLKLRWGIFNYSMYSDAETDEQIEYPLVGTYKTEGTTVLLRHEKIHEGCRLWIRDRVNGVPVLWRDDGLDLWRKESRIHTLAVLIRARSLIPFVDPPRPSLYSLYTPDMFAREKREYDERFNDQPPQVRTLMRLATTDVNSSWEEYQKNRDEYTSQLRRARETMTPDLIRPLITLLGHKGSQARNPARRILLEIYGLGYILKEEPPFKRSKAERDRALTVLVDALALVKDRRALEDTLGIFLMSSEVRTMNVPVPEAGVRIHLEGGATDWRDLSGHLEGSGGPENWKWEKEMPFIVAACQKWMMQQIGH